MINLILLSLYSIIILIYIITSFFIVYHLATYSINPNLKTIMLVFFIVVSIGLLASNLTLFFSIDWDIILAEILP
jgi:hypothetical protein